MPYSDQTDWDDAFANMAHVPDSEALPAIWTARAQAYRGSGVRWEEHRYGSHEREALDLIWPDGAVEGLAVFIHGGYWMRLDKSYWTDLAEGARARGWAVCMPSYTLTPEARISQITQQIAAAINHAASLVQGPIRLSGHSAGGHLATRMLCADSSLNESVQERVEHTLSISGLYDLRPLMQTQMNDTLKLDAAEAASESAALLMPLKNARLCAWVGGGERPEFIRQSRLIDCIWRGLDARVQCAVDAMHNHFTVIDGLREPDSDITRAFFS